MIKPRKIIQLKHEHRIYNADFEMKEVFEEFLNQKLEAVEEVYDLIKVRKGEIEEAAKGHRLAEHMEEEYQELFEALQTLKEEIEEAQGNLAG